MKGKKYRKKQNNNSPAKIHTSMSTQALLKIKFEISNDNISCFINPNRNTKHAFRNTSQSSNKRRSQSLKVRKVSKAKVNNVSRKPVVIPKEQPLNILQESSNEIISKIQEKGLLYAWQEGDDNLHRAIEEADLEQNLSIWSDYTVFNDSLDKSYASTNDYHFFGYENKGWDYHSNNLQKPSESLASNTNISNNFVIIPELLEKDWRTTIMIRNIPNKYSISELAQQIDSEHMNIYDFLYLPCDIRNQCNVGYGFINFISTSQMESFYSKFQDYPWRKYRSEKICSLAYARLQGLNQLIEHFANSKVLNQKDKKYRPIIKYDNVHKIVREQQERRTLPL